MIRTRFAHITASGTTHVSPPLATLVSVNVNTAASGSTVTVYNNTDASDDVVAVIDGGTVASKGYMVYCDKGITVAVTGSPDVTVGYI